MCSQLQVDIWAWAVSMICISTVPVFWCPFVNDKYRLPHLVVWRVMTSPAGAGCSSWLVVGCRLCCVSKVQLLGRDTGDVRQCDSELSSSAVLWCCFGVSGPEHFQACELLKTLCCTCSNTGTCSWCPTLQKVNHRAARHQAAGRYSTWLQVSVKDVSINCNDEMIPLR